jgi:hypothetical protein
MKKGLMFSTLVLLILVSFSIFGLALIVSKADAGIKKTEDIDRCYFSVIRAGVTKIGPETLYAIDCPRIYHEVDPDDVKKSGKVTEDLLKHELAEQLKNCWYKSGKGSAKGFNENVFKSWQGVFTDSPEDYVCLVCSTLDFKDVRQEAQEDLGRIKFSGFMSYLDDTPISTTSSESYIEYLTMDKNYTKDSNFFSVTEVSGTGELVIMDSIDLERTYHIFYVVYQGEWLANKMDTAVTWLQDVFGMETDLGFINSDESYGSIFVATDENIRKVKCGSGLLN